MPNQPSSTQSLDETSCHQPSPPSPVVALPPAAVTLWALFIFFFPFKNEDIVLHTTAQ